jgi:hypothetical protein
MPRMLGWFALREGTSVEDAEWLCARAAGLDAGFALATSIHSTAQLTADESSAARPREEGNFAAILHAIRTWETARMAGAFPEEVKLQLQKPAREFHLVAADANHWDLQGVESLKAHVSASGSQVNFTNPYASQPLVIFARNSGRSPVTQLNLRLGSQQLRLDGELKPGQILLYAGGNSLVVFDRRWRETGRQSVGGTGLNANKGVQKLGCDWAGQGEISLELRTLSPPQRLTGAGPACQLLPSAAAN